MYDGLSAESSMQIILSHALSISYGKNLGQASDMKVKCRGNRFSTESRNHTLVRSVESTTVLISGNIMHKISTRWLTRYAGFPPCHAVVSSHEQMLGLPFGNFSQKKNIGRKGLFTFKFGNPGWTEQSKTYMGAFCSVVLYVEGCTICEQILDYFSMHSIWEFKVKVFDTFNANFAVGK